MSEEPDPAVELPEPQASPATAPAAAASAPARHSHVVVRVVALILTGVALYMVLPGLAAVLGAWPRLASLNIWWLVIGLLAECGSFACGFATQRIVLRTRSWFAVVTAGLAGNAVTNSLPGGDAAGAAVQFRMLSDAGVRTDAAAGGLAASSFLGLGGLLMLPLLALPAVVGRVGVNHALIRAAAVGVAGFLVYLAFGSVLLAMDRPLRGIARALQWLWNHIRRPRPRLTGLEDRLVRQRNEIRRALGQQWKQIFALVVGRLGLDYLCLLAALRATGSEPRIWLVLLAYSAAGVIALFPITPGGLGIVEASLSGLLVLAGVNSGSAVVATLAYRLDQYWIPTLAGAVAYWLFFRRYRRGAVG